MAGRQTKVILGKQGEGLDVIDLQNGQMSEIFAVESIGLMPGRKINFNPFNGKTILLQNIHLPCAHQLAILLYVFWQKYILQQIYQLPSDK